MRKNILRITKIIMPSFLILCSSEYVSLQEKNPQLRERIIGQIPQISQISKIYQEILMKGKQASSNTEEMIIDQQNRKNKQKEDEETKITIEEKRVLTNNSVVLPKNCPEKIVQYFLNCGFQIHKTSSSNQKIQIQNNIGDEKQFILSEITKDEDEFYKFTNFLNPPKIVSSQQEMSEVTDCLKDDENLVFLYLPQNYIKERKHEFDTFTEKKWKNIEELRRNFIDKKYASGSNKNYYVIINDKQVANYLKIGENKVGQIFVLMKPSLKTGKQASTIIGNSRFIFHQIKNSVDFETNFPINQIDIDGQMAVFLRKLRINSDKRKILIVSSRERRPQFLKSINEILLKVAKIMEQEVLIVVTKNEKLLKKYFQIVPDDFVTVRLIDLYTNQPPLFSYNRYYHQETSFSSRKVLSGPFSIENLCQFITNPQSKQYYEKNLLISNIPSITNDELQNIQNTVVLFEKNGCSGCKFVKNMLENLQQIISNLSSQSKYKYHIQHPELLLVNLRRINILNEDRNKINRDGYDVTPRLIYYDGKYHRDLEIEKILNRLNEIGKKEEAEVHKELMRELIERIIEGRVRKQKLFDE